MKRAVDNVIFSMNHSLFDIIACRHIDPSSSPVNPSRIRPVESNVKKRHGIKLLTGSLGWATWCFFFFDDESGSKNQFNRNRKTEKNQKKQGQTVSWCCVWIAFSVYIHAEKHKRTKIKKNARPEAVVL